MKFLKKSVAALLAAAFCASAAGCSNVDKSWSMKDSSTTLPIGCYVYNLYTAYEQADSKKTDSSKAVLDQQIDSKDAKTWIRDTAFTGTKEVLLVDQKLKSMNLTLSDDDKKNADTLNSSAWSQYSTTMEKIGVAQSSFNKVYGELIYKERKIFEATYGKKGTQAVSDDDLKAYYVKNYTDFSYIVCNLYTTDSSGNYSASFTDAQKKEAKATIDGYVSQIKAGKLTVDKAATEYQSSIKSTSEQLHNGAVNLDTDTNYPEALRTALKKMKTGDVQALELTDLQAYVLIYRKDAAADADTIIASDTSRNNLLYECKGTEFSDNLKKEAEAMTNVTVNEAALNSYDPKMFA